MLKFPYIDIIHQHLVKGTVCTSAVINQIKVRNILDNLLHVTRDEAEKLRVDGGIIDTENTLGTNGVIHAIEKVLIPPQGNTNNLFVCFTELYWITFYSHFFFFFG